MICYGCFHICRHWALALLSSTVCSLVRSKCKLPDDGQPPPNCVNSARTSQLAGFVFTAVILSRRSDRRILPMVCVKHVSCWPKINNLCSKIASQLFPLHRFAKLLIFFLWGQHTHWVETWITHCDLGFCVLHYTLVRVFLLQQRAQYV